MVSGNVLVVEVLRVTVHLSLGLQYSESVLYRSWTKHECEQNTEQVALGVAVRFVALLRS